MCIGAHTLSHSKLSRMSDELAFGEIQQSRRVLAQALGKGVWAFAYPFGDPSAVAAREIAFAEQCGFTCAFLNVEARPEYDRSLFTLPRVHVTRDVSLAEIDARVSGFHGSLRQWFA